MFKSLGLFTAACPDADCRRISCFFKHGGSSSASRSSQVEAAGNKPALRKRGLDSQDLKSSAKVVAQSTPLAPEAGAVESKRLQTEPGPHVLAAAPKKARVISDAKGTPKSVVKKDSDRPSMHEITRNVKTDQAPDSASVSNAQTPPSVLDISRPPLIPRQKGLSPQPYVDRQKALTTLYQQYTKLYSGIIHLAPDLAHKSSIEQEADISASSTNVRAYKTAIHHAAVNISRRSVPDRLDHPSVGTVKESRIATENAERARTSRPTRDRIAGYCLHIDEFGDWRYPDPKDETLTIGGGDDASAEGTTQECARCKSSFVVTPKDYAEPHGCKYHYGKTAPERVEGRRKWIYSCCGRERGEAGCQDGVHVFTEREDDHKLKARAGFRTVRQVVQNSSRPKGWVDVVAMDCEMIYTTAGSSLARVTVVDEDGAILIDELVRQTVPVLDLNSRFSGINEGDLEKAIMDLDGAREAACIFIGPDTIIVGHGLENDLRALRLVHDKVIDTAILFPHDKGRPFRRALRDIVKEKLGYFIQDRTSDLGHSSAEDAKATLECLKWKVRDDANDRRG